MSFNTTSLFSPPTGGASAQPINWAQITLLGFVALSQVAQWARKVKRSKCWGIEIEMKDEEKPRTSTEPPTPMEILKPGGGG